MSQSLIIMYTRLTAILHSIVKASDALSKKEVVKLQETKINGKV